MELVIAILAITLATAMVANIAQHIKLINTLKKLKDQGKLERTVGHLRENFNRFRDTHISELPVTLKSPSPELEKLKRCLADPNPITVEMYMDEISLYKAQLNRQELSSVISCYKQLIGSLIERIKAHTESGKLSQKLTDALREELAEKNAKIDEANHEIMALTDLCYSGDEHRYFSRDQANGIAKLIIEKLNRGDTLKQATKDSVIPLEELEETVSYKQLYEIYKLGHERTLTRKGEK